MSNFTGQLQVDFVHDPTSASFTWVDITTRGRAANYRRGRSYERNQVETGTGTVKLRNDDGALDPTNTGSVFSPNVLPFKRFQHNITVGGVGTVPIFTGLVERWPQEWETGYGYAPVRVVDVFSWLAASSLRSCYEQEVLADSPLCFYPLTEAAGATSAGDASGNGVGALLPYTYISGDLTFAAGSSQPAEQAPLLNVNASLTTASGDDLSGDYMVATTPYVTGLPHSTFTLEAWVTVNPSIVSALNRSAQHLTIVAGLTSGPSLFLLYTVADGTVKVLTENPGATAVGPDLNDGKIHHLAQTSDGTAVRSYVDGTLVNSASWTQFWNTASMAPWIAGAPATAANSGNGSVPPFRGTVGYFAVYPTTLSAARITAHYTAGLNAFAGDTADARIARLLSYGGWTATTALDACTTTMLGATGLAGQSVLAAIQNVQTAEGGVFFASKAGVLTYKSRRTRMQATVSAATFGENVAGGEVPYVDIALDFDPTYIYNDVQITRTDTSTASAKSPTSQSRYGLRSYATRLDIQSDGEALDAANWILNTSLAPNARVRSVTIDCLATSGAWAAVLPLDIGSRVTVKRRPFGGAPVITVNSFVESIAWDVVDSSRAMCTLELSPIPLQALIADDATYGLCDSTFVAAW